jgi:hypothetical protein
MGFDPFYDKENLTTNFTYTKFKQFVQNSNNKYERVYIKSLIETRYGLLETCLDTGW